NTSVPSGVNFSRLAPRTSAPSVCTTALLVRSMIEIVPSCALATQASRPSGDTSIPSAPRPTGTTVSVQSTQDAPPGAAAGGAGGPGGPGGLGDRNGR